MAPPAPSLAIVELAATSDGSALLAELFGRVSPAGQMVRKLLRVASPGRVMFKSAADASAGSGFPKPASVRFIVCAAPSGPDEATPIGPSGAGRVSSTRVGVIGTKTCA